MLCDEHGKHLYSSPHTARSALTGQLRSKRIRVYPCEAHKGQYHVTKEKIERGQAKQRRVDRSGGKRSRSKHA